MRILRPTSPMWRIDGSGPIVTNQLKAGQLVANGGPRFYFETTSPTGSGSHLDHPVWRKHGVRFLVHLDVRDQSATDCAASLIDDVGAFLAAFRTAQPGIPIRGFGIRLAALGGWYGYQDFNGYVPIASCNPQDALPQFVNGFTYSPVPTRSGEVYQTGTVSSSGYTPTSSSFRIGSGLVHGRPEGGLVTTTMSCLPPARSPDSAARSRLGSETSSP